jgi:hypothetical protein
VLQQIRMAGAGNGGERLAGTSARPTESCPRWERPCYKSAPFEKSGEREYRECDRGFEGADRGPTMSTGKELGLILGSMPH